MSEGLEGKAAKPLEVRCAKAGAYDCKRCAERFSCNGEAKQTMTDGFNSPYDFTSFCKVCGKRFPKGLRCPNGHKMRNSPKDKTWRENKESENDSMNILRKKEG